MLEEFSELVFGRLLTSKGTMHSSAAECKAGNQMHIAVTPWRNGLTTWTNSKVLGSGPTGGEWVRH